MNASDADVGRNAEVTYALTDLDPDDTEGQGHDEGQGRDGACVEKFVVDPESGEVTARTRLDHEQQAVYQCRLLAVDAGQPPNTGSNLLSSYQTLDSQR